MKNKLPFDLECLLLKAEAKYFNKLNEISDHLVAILKELKTMSKEFDDLTAQVTRNSEVLDSAVVLINGIADRITAAGVDPVKLKALTDELKAKDDALAAAVVANTPATSSQPPVTV